MKGLLFTVSIGSARVSASVKAPNDINKRPSLRRVLMGIRDFCQTELDKLGDNENADGGRAVREELN